MRNPTLLVPQARRRQDRVAQRPDDAGAGRFERWHRHGDGKILVGTDEGLFLHDSEDGGFEAVDGTEGEDVYFVLQSDDGAVRLGTRTGLLTVRPSGVERLDRGTGLSNDHVRAIVRDADGVLWVGTYGSGLNRVEGGKVTVFDTRNGMAENVVSRIIEDAAGRFWLTGNRGVTRVPRARLEAVARGNAERVAVDLFDAAVFFSPDQTSLTKRQDSVKIY